MSKLGSAPPPPPYKVPLSERIFGIGKLRPPVTDGAGGADLLSTIKLGSFSLELDGTGAWQMDSKLEQMYRAQITQLEAKVAQLEDERLNKNVYELEKRNIALERERLAVVDENNQLKFKNKVLMAMCTIAEVGTTYQTERRHRRGQAQAQRGILAAEVLVDCGKFSHEHASRALLVSITRVFRITPLSDSRVSLLTTMLLLFVLPG